MKMDNGKLLASSLMALSVLIPEQSVFTLRRKFLKELKPTGMKMGKSGFSA